MYTQYLLLVYLAGLLKSVESSLIKQQGKIISNRYSWLLKFLIFLNFRFTKLNSIFFGSLYAFSQSFIYFATSAAISIGAIIFIKDSNSTFHADLVDIFQ